MTFAPLAFGPITGAMLAAYSEASFDHNPIHRDASAARQAGFDSIIVHGLLPVAIMARAVRNWVPMGRLTRLSARFVAPTPEGALIRVTARTVSQTGPALRLDLCATTGDGIVVIRGEADLVIPRLPVIGAPVCP